MRRAAMQPTRRAETTPSESMADASVDIARDPAEMVSLQTTPGRNGIPSLGRTPRGKGDGTGTGAGWMDPGATPRDPSIGDVDVLRFSRAFHPFERARRVPTWRSRGNGKRIEDVGDPRVPFSVVLGAEGLHVRGKIGDPLGDCDSVPEQGDPSMLDILTVRIAKNLGER